MVGVFLMSFLEEGTFTETGNPPTKWHHVCGKYNGPICQLVIFAGLFNVRGLWRIVSMQQVHSFGSFLFLRFSVLRDLTLAFLLKLLTLMLSFTPCKQIISRLPS